MTEITKLGVIYASPCTWNKTGYLLPLTVRLSFSLSRSSSNTSPR